MPTVVRTILPEDLEGVLHLYRELRPHDPPLEPQLARDAFAGLITHENVDLIVCESDGVLTATCMLAVVPNLGSGARPFGVVEHVVTLPKFRRRGHARLVLGHALNLAWSRFCYKVVLLSGAQRKEAHKLYESVGFVGGIEEGFVARPLSATGRIVASGGR
jgi:GNAT superfamily N-acetyltransferase